MSRPSSISRPRRALVAGLVAFGIAAGAAAPALAQDSLPDPNKADSTQSPKQAAKSSGDLPTTGIEASWLVLAGLALGAAGIAVRPAARMRRRYSTDDWHHAVR